MRRRHRAALAAGVVAGVAGLLVSTAGGAPATIKTRPELIAKRAGHVEVVLFIASGAGPQRFEMLQEAGTNNILVHASLPFGSPPTDCTLEDDDTTARCNENAFDGIIVRPGRGSDRVIGRNSLLKPTNQFGGRGDDKLRGGGVFDFLKGGKGDDNCEGGPGQETIKSCE